MERRHTDKSTILCTQYRIEDWHARLGGGIHADAIIDRIVNNSVHIYAGELNMRKVKNMIIPWLFEPPVRTLRATVPENGSHIFR